MIERVLMEQMRFVDEKHGTDALFGELFDMHADGEEKLTGGELFLAISMHVEELAKERICPVFLIDEAHLLHQDTLDHLHILLNYQWDSKPLLSLVLIGLPELDDRLRLRRNRSLYSRIHHRFQIGSLVPDDTADYLRMRLARV